VFFVYDWQEVRADDYLAPFSSKVSTPACTIPSNPTARTQAPRPFHKITIPPLTHNVRQSHPINAKLIPEKAVHHITQQANPSAIILNSIFHSDKKQKVLR
jgi:hypothetical protein